MKLSSLDTSCCARKRFSRLPVPRSSSCGARSKCARAVSRARTFASRTAAGEIVRYASAVASAICRRISSPLSVGDAVASSACGAPRPRRRRRRAGMRTSIVARACCSRRHGRAIELDAAIQRRRRHVAVDLKPRRRPGLGEQRLRPQDARAATAADGLRATRALESPARTSRSRRLRRHLRPAPRVAETRAATDARTRHTHFGLPVADVFLHALPRRKALG